MKQNPSFVANTSNNWQKNTNEKQNIFIKIEILYINVFGNTLKFRLTENNSSIPIH